MRNNCIGVPMTQPMFTLEPIDNFHVLHAFLFLNKFDPVINWLAIFLFNGWEVRCWTRSFCLFAHLNTLNKIYLICRHTKDSQFIAV